MPFWENIGSFLPVVGQGIQSAINARTARENTDKTIQANKAMAEYQYSKDLEMWNRGNVYNAPQAQMDRLKKAGLNPNMIYGAGNAVGQAAGQLPKYNAPTMQYNYQPPVDLPSMISQFQDFRIRSAQARNLGAKADVAEDTVWSAGQLIKDKAWLQRIARDNAREFAGPLAQSQLEFARGKIRSQSLEQDRLIKATENLALQNEYFAEKAIGGLLGGAVGSVAKVVQMFRGGKGALGTGTLKSFGNMNNARYRWKGKYTDVFGYE